MVKIKFLLLIALVSTACQPQLPSSPTIVTQIVTIGTTNPSPSPSPTAGCVVKSVRVGFFGNASSCDPKNNQGDLKVSCTAPVTATPKGDSNMFPPNGDVPSTIHGDNIVWTILAGASNIKMNDTDNLFNKDITGVSPTPQVTIQATVTQPNCPAVTGQFSFAVIP